MTNLGAPNTYYINLSASVLGSDISRFDAAVDAAISGGATGLILDLRLPFSGGIDHRFLARRLICSRFSSMTYNIPILTGPDLRSVDSSHYEVDPVNPYCGPIVLLVSPLIVSAAEDFGAMLTGAHRVTLIGRQSAGTNGNVTGVQLPGAVGLSFTGMEVRNVDGSVFHGVGFVPQINVTYTVQDIVTNRDRDLEAAIQYLQGP